jgi:hypothetical protein
MMDEKTKKVPGALRPVEKFTRDAKEGVTCEASVTCFNRDPYGQCMAFKEGVCSPDCSARIPTIEAKIELLVSLIAYSKSKVVTADLNKELANAKKVQDAERSGRYEGWMACYYEDRRRGSGGGSSEHDSNRSTGMKTLLKDNRGIDTKPTKSQMAEYQAELGKWEEENGKLPKLARSSLGKSKTDSYLNPDESQ